jgi:hypothetical protein
LELIFILNEVYNGWLQSIFDRSNLFLFFFLFIFFTRLRKQIIVIFVHIALLIHSSSYSVFFIWLLFFRFLTVCSFLCLLLCVGVCECWLLFCHHHHKKLLSSFFLLFKIARCVEQIRVFHRVQVKMFIMSFFRFILLISYTMIELNTFGRQ